MTESTTAAAIAAQLAREVANATTEGQQSVPETTMPHTLLVKVYTMVNGEPVYIAQTEVEGYKFNHNPLAVQASVGYKANVKLTIGGKVHQTALQFVEVGSNGGLLTDVGKVKKVNAHSRF